MVQSIADNSGPGNEISFVFGEVVIENTEFDATGRAVGTTEYSYDLVNGQQGAAVADPVVGTADASVPPVLDYYVRFEGIPAFELASGVAGAFLLESFSFSKNLRKVIPVK